MKNKKRLNFLNTLQMDLAVFFALTASIIAVDTFEEWFYSNVPTHLSQKENFHPRRTKVSSLLSFLENIC